MTPNIAGALLMMASMVSFTINDTFLKLTDGALELPQLLAIRGVLASALLIGLAVALRGLHFRLGARAWVFVLARSLAEVGAAYYFLTALFNMPLANVTAVLQMLPLTVTLGAFLFLGDPVGWRRALAIAVGFVGMLLILRPGPEGFSIWSLYAVIAVLCVTARDLITRRMPKHVPSLTVAAANTVVVTLFFGAWSIAEPWQPVSTDLGWLIVGSAFFVIGGYFFSVQAMRTGEISFIAPFRYTSLIAALILGLAVFGHWPDPLTLLGAAIIVGAGVFTFWRERARTAAASAPHREAAVGK